MPSVLHLTAEDFRNNHYQRVLIGAHKPHFILFHLPSFTNGRKIYTIYEELAKRVGSFVGLASVNVEAVSSSFIRKKFQVSQLPAIRFWKQGKHKVMFNYSTSDNNNIPQTADEMEDFILDNLIETNATLEYDYLSDEENENDAPLLKLKQETELKTAKRVFIFTILYPENPSQNFESIEDLIDRKIRRVESMIHVLAIHDMYSKNNNNNNAVRLVIVKQSDQHLVDSIRIKIELKTGGVDSSSRGSSSIILFDREDTLESLKNPDSRMPCSLSFHKLSQILSRHTKPPIPKEHRMLMEDPKLDFVIKTIHQDDDDDEDKKIKIHIRYRRVFDGCSSLRECSQMKKENEDGSKTAATTFPFIVRNVAEFRDPKETETPIHNADDLLKIFRSEESATHIVDGLLPHFDYQRESVRDIANRWSRTGEDFEINMFQAHVNRSTFGFKLPKVFDEVAPTTSIDSRTGKENQKEKH